MPPPSTEYDRRDIERWLDGFVLEQAQDYVEAVSDLRTEANGISARVQGSQPVPYAVDIRFTSGRNGRTGMVGRCSCPVGQQCKHVAAVLLKGLEAEPQAEQVRPSVLGWISELQRLAEAPGGTAAKHHTQTQRLFYVVETHRDRYRLACYKGRMAADGRPAGNLAHWNNYERALSNPPQFVDEEDQAILRLLWAQRPRELHHPQLPIAGRHGAEILRHLLDTGRWLSDAKARQPLREGPERTGRLGWRHDADGNIHAEAQAEPPADLILPLDPPWYVDTATGEAGPLALDTPSGLLQQLLTGPAFNHAEARVVAATLKELAPAVPSPLGGEEGDLRDVDGAPIPILRIRTVPIAGLAHYRDYEFPLSLRFLDVAMPDFRYGEFRLAPTDKREFLLTDAGEMVRIRRQPEAERAWLDTLAQFGFKPIPRQAVIGQNTLPDPTYGLASEAAWADFVADIQPRLEADGWQVELPADFRHYYYEVEAWDADIGETAGGWFNLDMGIVVEGRRLPLAPLLAGLFQADTRWLDRQKLDQIPETEFIPLNAPDGKRIRVAAGRIKPLARTLIDLFDRPIPADGKLALPRLDALRLAELASLERWQFRGLGAVNELAAKLRNSLGVRPVEPPEGFQLELRPYQKEGLAWLQYLREHELAGILADDMGLGKTAQTLAHLLTEKVAGRLDRPALVVLPTSLIFNWKREAARFAPDLKVLSLHGKERHENFEAIPEHDVVLTTYPLLWRDHEELEAHAYHLLILDEAQTVKNAASKSAAVVRRLRARHRLCLTGTPLENHLGELWSQFDFLLPGLLGDSKTFTKSWRTPIEKHGDLLRRDLLARRLRPFMLRRRKEEVAKELPPKTVILRTVELEGGQRDLYETVRSAMDAKVREAVAAQGFSRSQIVILDALLKLRQVCCDPSLLKSEAAKRVKERAKLHQLMDMLPELVDEGRRILVFSQFTTMLALIQEELQRLHLPYALLTGDTVDRETPIRRFQDGEVPIFLISLKAGGVGLNLTAADTVIHYDPWWNPAVENQATDRAHRLGQTKPVFVYKLIVSGSIEEKILALQEKKAELAAGILSEDRAGEVKFSEADLAALLAPLPEK